MSSEEAIAAELLRTLQISEPASAIEIAWRYWGRGRVYRVPAVEVWGDSELTDEGIVVLGSMPLERQNHAIAARLVEHYAQRTGAVVDCAVAGAALLMPPARFSDWTELAGGVHEVRELARAFRVEETAAVLRAGETAFARVAVVAPTHVRSAGGALPAGARELARADIRPAGLRAVRLRDRPERTALLMVA